MTDIFDVAATLKQRPASIQDKLDKIQGVHDERPVNNNTGPTDSNAVTVHSVGRTERRPTKGEGERAFGPPTSPPPLRSAADNSEIRRQQALAVKQMNQRANQSTDSTN